MDFDYKNDVAIDQNDLDSEWIKQAGLYAHWAGLYAKALAKKDLVWLEKKILKAQLYKKFKLESETSGKKPTENAVDAEVHSSDEYKEVSNRLIDEEEIVNILDSIKWAMEQKKKALENLSRDQGKAYNMPDGYSRDRREDAIERKNQESEKIDREQRKQIKR